MLVVSFVEAAFTLTVIWYGYTSHVGMTRNLELSHGVMNVNAN